jgi:hypothetical protein
MTTNDLPPSKTRSTKLPGTPLLPPGSAGAVTKWWSVQWPRIGGVDLLPLARDAFTDPRFKAGYEPGTLVFIYAGACGEDHRNPIVATGLLGVARRLFAAIHKVSVTAQVHIRSRLRELNADHYGSMTMTAEGHLCSDLGFDNWIAQHILPNGKPLSGSAVRIGERCLEVRLPLGLSCEEFEERLHHRMRNAALNDWLDTHAGRAHCAEIGRQPCEFKRLTGYGFGRSKRFSEAKEFYFFRPKTDDADRLVRIAEAIIHDYVVNPASRTASVSFKSVGQGFSDNMPIVD